jgi:hypothetical protein
LRNSISRVYVEDRKANQKKNFTIAERSSSDDGNGDCPMNIRFAFVFVGAGTLLAACSGSGGNSAMNPVPFTSYSAIQNAQPVQANGISQTVSATTAPFGNVTSTLVNAVDSASSSAQLTYAGIGSGTAIPPAVSAFSFNSPTSNVSFSGLSVQCGTAGTGFCSASNSNSVAVVINPLDPPSPNLAWNYQSFGYWLVLASGTSTIAGAMSFGNPTPAAGVPVGGTATYSGVSGGTYVDQTGAVFIQRATLIAGADFGARTVSFQTTGTQTAPVPTPLGMPTTFTPNAFLDIIPVTTLAYSPVTNQFTGIVKAPGATGTILSPTLTGTVTGRFYGPAAQEIGGVFFLKAGTGPETMLGGFGGKQ